ncbi:response regulator [Magnetovibrio sp.]|uniref:response regulator n=1 Tax=Magnetovibrio sp. TaxID=2024836 RepID=UPI002F91C2B2
MVQSLENLVVLLVDDEQFIRQLVARLLRDMGVREVMTAEDGEDAVKKLNTYAGRIGLVILDLEMPNKNGFQVIQEVRRGTLNIDPNLPIIILTGHGQQGAVKSAVKLGVHGFLVKPMSRDALEKRIKVALSSGPIDPARLEKQNHE